MPERWRYVRAGEIDVSPMPLGPLLDVVSPTKVPEYLALGVPVVCNDNPDQQDLIQASGAGRCIPYTAVDFAEAVLELLRLPSQAREELARNGASLIASERAYIRLTEQVATVYQSLARRDRAEATEEIAKGVVTE